jgi:hypothetical protein
VLRPVATCLWAVDCTAANAAAAAHAGACAGTLRVLLVSPLPLPGFFVTWSAVLRRPPMLVADTMTDLAQLLIRALVT